MSFLLSHPNRHGPHYYTSRRGSVLAFVVHITAGLEDLDATDDHSAENTARYAATTDRAVSWHSGSDADSAFDLLPASYTAFHVRGYNSRTYGHEISKADTDWRDAPEPWRTRTLGNAARHLGPKADALGVPRRLATRAELDHAIATGGGPVGFISHAALDPSRRTDPGLVRGVDTFPWADFFAHMGTTDQEDDSMSAEEVAQITAAINDTRSFLAQAPGTPELWIVNRDLTKRWVDTEEAWRAVRTDRILHAGTRADGVTPTPVHRTREHLEALHTVGPVPPGWA